MIKQITKYTGIIILDLLLFFISIITVTCIKNNSLSIIITDIKELLFLSLFWVIISLINRKYFFLNYKSIVQYLRNLYITNIVFFLLFITTLFLTKFHFSRFIILGSFILLTLLESFFYSLIYVLNNKNKKNLHKWYNIILFIIIDFILFYTAYILLAIYKPATIREVLPNYNFYALTGALIWINISFFSSKYIYFWQKKEKGLIKKVLTINLLISGITILFLYISKYFILSRLLIIGTLLLTNIFNLIVSWLFIMYWKYQKVAPERIEQHFITEQKEIDFKIKNEELPLKKDVVRYDPQFAKPEILQESILLILLQKYLKKTDELFEFLNDSLALENIHKKFAVILNTKTSYNFENLEENSLEFIGNLHKINDFRRINQYFIKVNQSLKNGAIFFGCAETLAERQFRIKSKLPKIISSIFYFFDFMINRVLPKINSLKGLYFAITKGRNRPLSRCEILGRIIFCGFEIVNVKEFQNNLYFIAKKIKNPSDDKNPSYAPIFKMRRRGKGGEHIYVYKFRTMHPYAEYLQAYMVENFGYSTKGKLMNDFRVTKWGKVFRKLWLDESPQIINFFKGELGIVGVRPLSERMLKEYPKDITEERFNYKPGCIPPYVSLNMQGVKKSIDAERIYLKQKKKNPIWTDIKFFFMAIYNIVGNKIRSE